MFQEVERLALPYTPVESFEKLAGQILFDSIYDFITRNAIYIYIYIYARQVFPFHLQSRCDVV